MFHDRNFKNLILDYLYQALASLYKQLKYLDFIDIYAALDDNERVESARRAGSKASIKAKLWSWNAGYA